MNNKCIVIFAAYIYPHLGGIESYLDNLINELHKLKYNIVIVTSNWNDEKEFEKTEKYDVLRIPVLNLFKKRYPIPKKGNKLKSILKKLDKYNISTIIVNTRFHLTSHIGADYAKKNNIPCFLIEHGSSYITVNNKILDFFANRYEDYLTRRIKNKITGFYGVSNRCNEWLKKINIKASGTFNNAIDKECYKRYHNKVTNNKIIITYAGRILYEKGVGNLLEAFSTINNKNCELIIAGDGNALDELKTKYKSKNIKFLGRINHDEVMNLFDKTDIFVYPSMYPEGLPTSILEAGIMKCAIIATDRGGTVEVINSRDLGIIVEENVEDLTDKLKYLIDNPKEINRLKENIHDRVLNDYTWEKTAKTIIKEIKKYEK